MKIKKPYIDYISSVLVTDKDTIPITAVDYIFTQQIFEDYIYSDDNKLMFVQAIYDGKFGGLYAITTEEITEEVTREGIFPSGKKFEYTSCYIKNICFDEENICLDDFPNGHCFFPEVWQSANGKILILKHYH